RSALVHGDDDVLHPLAPVAESDQAFRNDGPLSRQIIFQIGAHRALPVDLAQPRSSVAGRAAQGTTHGLPEWFREPALNVFNNPTDDVRCRLTRARRN